MPPVVNRRQLLQTAAALVAPTVLPAWAAPLPQLTLSGPPAIVSAPLIHMAQSNALAGVAAKTVFTPWRDPDQLRVMAIGNKADILAMPSNVAANLYNRGAGVQLLNIATWGALWVVTRDGQRQTLLDFKDSVEKGDKSGANLEYAFALGLIGGATLSGAIGKDEGARLQAKLDETRQALMSAFGEAPSAASHFMDN